MKTLFTIHIKVTTPYKVDNEDVIKSDYKEVFTQALREVVQTELDNLEITGLAVEVVVR